MYNAVKTMYKTIVIFLWLFFLIIPIVGCTTQTSHVISTNKFVQTNYDYDCLDSNKTFTQIIICYQKQDAAEKVQNDITNELINKE